MKIQQNTPFDSDILIGQNGKKYALLNKREVETEDSTQYVADGFDITGVSDPKRYLYQNYSDPIFFKWQRGEAQESDWTGAISEIKELAI